MFGIGLPPDKPSNWWDWQGELRDENAFVVQMLISPGDSGFAITEVSAALMALNPSRDTRSWIESHAEPLGKSLVEAANVTEAVAGSGLVGTSLGAVLKASSVLSNFIGSGEGKKKN